MLNFCGIVAAILKNGDRQKFFDVGNQFGNLCGIVAAILKMVTDRKFSMAGINSGHHYLPTYQILMISNNVEFLPPIFLKMADISKKFKTQNCSSNGDLSLLNFMSLSLSIQMLSTLMYEISTFPQDSIVTPIPFEPLKI